MAHDKPHCWEPDYEKRYDEPWFRQLSPDRRSRIKEQDLDRAEMHKRVLRGEVGNEEFVKLCMAQVRENLGGTIGESNNGGSYA